MKIDWIATGNLQDIIHRSGNRLPTGFRHSPHGAVLAYVCRFSFPEWEV